MIGLHKLMKNDTLGTAEVYRTLIRLASAAAIAGGLLVSTPCSFASARSTALANDFEFFCMRGKPTYESLEEAAVALKLQPKKELARDMGNGNRIRSKSWTVGDNTGAYELVTSDAVNGDVSVESCGIGSADGLGGEVFADLQAHYNLGSAQASLSANGQVKTVVWTMESGEKVILTHATSGPGLYLTLIDKTKLGK
ncbi:hypothetical protein SAMN05414139_00011 [Burkholderia sp. D7]|nr:hypothetical protein SAMN05414139_00011 [Burkholderia sp. D7]